VTICGVGIDKHIGIFESREAAFRALIERA
jgi:hypothetical protein